MMREDQKQKHSRPSTSFLMKTYYPSNSKPIRWSPLGRQNTRFAFTIAGYIPSMSHVAVATALRMFSELPFWTE